MLGDLDFERLLIFIGETTLSSGTLPFCRSTDLDFDLNVLVLFFSECIFNILSLLELSSEFDFEERTTDLLFDCDTDLTDFFELDFCEFADFDRLRERESCPLPYDLDLDFDRFEIDSDLIERDRDFLDGDRLLLLELGRDPREA